MVGFKTAGADPHHHQELVPIEAEKSLGFKVNTYLISVVRESPSLIGHVA